MRVRVRIYLCVCACGVCVRVCVILSGDLLVESCRRGRRGRRDLCVCVLPGDLLVDCLSSVCNVCV